MTEIKNEFTRKFRHSRWFVGEDMTVKEFLDKAAKIMDLGLVSEIKYNNSEVVFDSNKEEIYYIKYFDGISRSKFRITQNEANYFKYKREKAKENLY